VKLVGTINAKNDAGVIFKGISVFIIFLCLFQYSVVADSSLVHPLQKEYVGHAPISIDGNLDFREWGERTLRALARR